MTLRIKAALLNKFRLQLSKCGGRPGRSTRGIRFALRKLELCDLCIQGRIVSLEFLDLSAQELRGIGGPIGSVAKILVEDLCHQFVGHARRRWSVAVLKSN